MLRTVATHRLLECLQTLLPELRAGIKEFDLIQILQAPPHCLFENVDLSDSLAMFQCHFVLFNALYMLRDTLLTQQQGILDIHVTKIVLKPYCRTKADLSEVDALRDYYLDWANFDSTGAQQVDALLDAFWKRYAGLKTFILERSEVLNALNVFGWCEGDEPSVAEVKQRYRKLLHAAHPDKGGKHEDVLRINQAFDVLMHFAEQAYIDG
ncbi:DNA-J related domain-containing protein [Aestuariibacter salexigens]|uniref:DNA-J related domain-containing protein n=1 Tax=Aestuariibacter salexigens TaxID=226010 RepID=UPI00041B869F|nr:DNA-J related domain-containing protein [Aestuariibacter salexigens]